MPLLVEDRHLLLGFRRGERSALARVYEHYAPMLSDFLRAGFPFESSGETLVFRGLQSRADLLDAVQESFVRAFREEARLAYDGLRPFKGYLFRIGRNLVLDELRRGRWAPIVAQASVLDEAPPSPDADLVEKEARDLVARFVDALPDRARAVYAARFERGLGQREAALAVGMTRIQLRRIEDRLKLDLLEFLRERGYLTSYRAKGYSLALADRRKKVERP